MRKIIFITYGNELYYKNLQRLKSMAQSTGLFDSIIVYTDKDMPEEITQHSLYQHKRGGGYWLWKPYIILKTLRDIAGDNDIVVYSDGGSEVFNSSLWQRYFDMLNKSSCLVFKFRCLMKHWTRQNLLNHYQKDCHNIQEYYQILSGLSLWRKNAIPIVQEWYDIMRLHPEMVIDVQPDELSAEPPHFIEHRHDQAVLSCIAYKREHTHNIKIQWEKSEVFYKKGQAVYFSRIRNCGEKGLIGRPHRAVSLMWQARHKLVNFVRDIRQFIYKHIL